MTGTIWGHLLLIYTEDVDNGGVAMVDSTLGHLGVARTTQFVIHNYSWPSLQKDVRQYVLACEFHRRKISTSGKV